MRKILAILRVVAQFFLSLVSGFTIFEGAMKISPIIDPKVGMFDDYLMSTKLFLGTLCLNIVASSLVVYMVGWLFCGKRAEHGQWLYCLIGSFIAALIGIVSGLGSLLMNLVVLYNFFFLFHYLWTSAGATIGYNLSLGRESSRKLGRETK